MLFKVLIQLTTDNKQGTPFKSQKGFTLLELMMAGVAGVVMLTAFSSYFANTFTFYYQTQNSVDLQDEAARIIRALTYGRESSDPDNVIKGIKDLENNGSLLFLNPTGDFYEKLFVNYDGGQTSPNPFFYFDSANDELHYYNDTGTDYLISTNIEAMEFREIVDPTNDRGVRVNFTLADKSDKSYFIKSPPESFLTFIYARE